MYVIFRSQDPEPVEEMEETLIRELRAKSLAVPRGDRPRCQNINPGREGTMRNGPPPYYVYLVVGDGRNLGATRVARERFRRQQQLQQQAAAAASSS